MSYDLKALKMKWFAMSDCLETGEFLNLPFQSIDDIESRYCLSARMFRVGHEITFCNEEMTLQNSDFFINVLDV
jgi:hypothetical protein